MKSSLYIFGPLLIAWLEVAAFWLTVSSNGSLPCRPAASRRKDSIRPAPRDLAGDQAILACCSTSRAQSCSKPYKFFR